MAFRCQTCNGTKQVMGLGMMLSKCKICDGTGFELAKDDKKDEKKDNKSKHVA